MRRLLIPLVLIVPVLAACGGSSTKAKTAAPAVATSVTTGGGAATTTTAPPNYSGNGGSSWCNFDRSLANSSNLQDMTKDPHAWANQVSGILNQAEGKAPGAIKADVHTLVGGMRSLLSALAGANYDMSKLTPAQMGSFASADVQAASQRITAYDTQVCGTKG